VPGGQPAGHEAGAEAGQNCIGGSDSHTMRGVGLTYTEVPGARTVAEYFAGLRAKRGRVRGAEGSLVGLTEDIYRIAGEMFKEKPATLAMLPLGVLIPVITAAHWANEMWFCRKWTAHF